MSGVNPRITDAATRAMKKAGSLYWEFTPVWEPEGKRWRVQSASHPDVIYHVTRVPNYEPGLAWWERLECTCPASDADYKVCYHKALVNIWWYHRYDPPGDFRPPALNFYWVHRRG